MTERHGKYDDLFQLLDAYIGQEMCCIYAEILSEEYQGVKAKLKQVHPYDSITLENGITYDFIGDKKAIVALGTMDGDKVQLLYKNSEISKKYPGYLNDPFGLITAQKETLGYSIKEEQVYNLPTVKNSTAAKK